MKKISSLLIMFYVLLGTSVTAEEQGVVSKVEKGVSKGAEAAGKGIEKGVDATVKGVKIGVDATGRGLKKAGEWVEEKLPKSVKNSSDKPVEKP